MGAHEARCLTERVEVNDGADLAELSLAARKRARKAGARRGDQTSADDEDDEEIVH